MIVNGTYFKPECWAGRAVLALCVVDVGVKCLHADTVSCSLLPGRVDCMRGGLYPSYGTQCVSLMPGAVAPDGDLLIPGSVPDVCRRAHDLHTGTRSFVRSPSPRFFPLPCLSAVVCECVGATECCLTTWKNYPV